MITRLQVKAFQSLTDVDLKFGKFTVIVGQTSSGKSAVVRALRTVARNANGNSFVTIGKKASNIIVETDDGYAVQLDRGKGISEYRVRSLDGSTMEETYTKAGTNTPDAVNKILRFATGADGDLLAVAGQFDKPFLLDAASTQVAKILGDLTNVTIIYGAQREANRLKLAANSSLKIRTKDLEDLRTRAKSFSGLKERVALLDRLTAEAAAVDSEARELEQAANTFNNFIVARKAYERLEASAPPSVSFDDAELDKLERVAAVIKEAEAHLNTIRQLAQRIEISDQERNDAFTAAAATLAEEEHMLAEAGVCPLCGNPTGVNAHAH